MGNSERGRVRYLGHKLLLQVRILLRALTRRLLLRRECISGELLLLLPVVIHIGREVLPGGGAQCAQAGASCRWRRSGSCSESASTKMRAEMFRGDGRFPQPSAHAPQQRGPPGVLPPMSKSLKKIMDAVQADQEVRAH